MGNPRSTAVALGLLVAFGCAHGMAADRFGASAWSRELTSRGVDPADAVYPFTGSTEINRWADETLRGLQGESGIVKLVALQEALFDPAFGFSYDADLTLTAAEAFEARQGNCMSFTVMFVAMARSAGLDAFLLSVGRPPEVERAESLVIINRHVVAGYRGGANEVTIFDFYITTSGPYIQRRVIDDVAATAMYHTNLGAAAIRGGDFDAAFRHLDIATTLRPDWAPGWVNLGVARSRNGDLDGAFEAYSRALEAEPQNPSALVNIAVVYRRQGRDEEAETALRAAAHQTTNPFTLIAMADVEMLRGRYSAAARFLRKARRWYVDEPEVHDALARLAELRGRDSSAAKHRRQAAAIRARSAEPGD